MPQLPEVPGKHVLGDVCCRIPFKSVPEKEENWGLDYFTIVRCCRMSYLLNVPIKVIVSLAA